MLEHDYSMFDIRAVSQNISDLCDLLHLRVVFAFLDHPQCPKPQLTDIRSKLRMLRTGYSSVAQAPHIHHLRRTRTLGLRFSANLNVLWKARDQLLSPHPRTLPPPHFTNLEMAPFKMAKDRTDKPKLKVDTETANTQDRARDEELLNAIFNANDRTLKNQSAEPTTIEEDDVFDHIFSISSREYDDQSAEPTPLLRRSPNATKSTRFAPSHLDLSLSALPRGELRDAYKEVRDIARERGFSDDKIIAIVNHICDRGLIDEDGEVECDLAAWEAEVEAQRQAQEPTPLTNDDLIVREIEHSILQTTFNSEITSTSQLVENSAIRLVENSFIHFASAARSRDHTYLHNTTDMSSVVTLKLASYGSPSPSFPASAGQGALTGSSYPVILPTSSYYAVPGGASTKTYNANLSHYQTSKSSTPASSGGHAHSNVSSSRNHAPSLELLRYKKSKALLRNASSPESGARIFGDRSNRSCVPLSEHQHNSGYSSMDNNTGSATPAIFSNDEDISTALRKSLLLCEKGRGEILIDIGDGEDDETRLGISTISPTLSQNFNTPISSGSKLSAAQTAALLPRLEKLRKPRKSAGSASMSGPTPSSRSGSGSAPGCSSRRFDITP